MQNPINYFFIIFILQYIKLQSVVQINTEINFEVLGTFFYRKKKALLPLAKASLSACRPLCRCVGSKPPKKLFTQFKTLGLCPKPHHLLKRKHFCLWQKQVYDLPTALSVRRWTKIFY
jgi:hypothetical protein